MNLISPATLRTVKSFYTVGYSHKTIEQFIRGLRRRGVATLVDIRHTPVSFHKSHFSKSNLRKALAEHGIAYVHLPGLGVPKVIRDQLSMTSDYDAFFRWYDANVVPRIETELTELLADIAKHPLAFMCMEQDQGKCHRSRLASALRRMGLTGFEIP